MKGIEMSFPPRLAPVQPGQATQAQRIGAESPVKADDVDNQPVILHGHAAPAELPAGLRGQQRHVEISVHLQDAYAALGRGIQDRSSPHYADLLGSKAVYFGPRPIGSAASFQYVNDLKDRADVALQDWAKAYARVEQGLDAFAPELPAEFTTFQGQMLAIARSDKDHYAKLYDRLYGRTPAPTSIPKPVRPVAAPALALEIAVPRPVDRKGEERIVEAPRGRLSPAGKCCLLTSFVVGALGTAASWWQLQQQESGSTAYYATMGGLGASAVLAAGSVLGAVGLWAADRC